MPFASNPIDGTQIQYEVDGSGPPLLLVHGTSGSLQLWAESGYRDALKSDYRLVMYDLRGHGESGHPHGLESYTPELHVSDVLAVLDDLGIQKSHVFGYSMGAWIGFAILKYAPHRMLSFVAGANHPYPKSGDRMLNYWIGLYEKGLEAVLESFEASTEETMSETARTNFLSQDVNAIVSVMGGVRDATGLDSDLGSVSIPGLGYAGAEDPVHELASKAATEIPSARFVSVEGLDHVQGFLRIDLVLPHIKEFLAEVESASPLN
jgi:pimeloyl-ACP methyl ester carboxylesterase